MPVLLVRNYPRPNLQGGDFLFIKLCNILIGGIYIMYNKVDNNLNFVQREKLIKDFWAKN